MRQMRRIGRTRQKSHPSYLSYQCYVTVPVVEMMVQLPALSRSR